jgi:signal transduction histidine kinase
VSQFDTSQREARARELRHDLVAQLTVGTHFTFRLLFALQWIAAAIIAWKTALPGESRLMFTLLLGAVLSVPAALFTYASPQAAWVRHFSGLCQIGWSMLFLWLLEGRPEAQFHLFVSLAVLALYRDWLVLISSTAAAVAYPVIRLATLPAAYEVGPSAWWRLFDQSAWVVAECLLMLFVVHQSLRTVQRLCSHTAGLQLTNEAIGTQVDERNAELERSREQYRLIAETTRTIPFELDLATRSFPYVGANAEKAFGIPLERWKEPGFLDALVPRDRESDLRRKLDDCAGGTFEAHCSVFTPDNRAVELRWTVSCEIVHGVRVLRGLMIDVTDSRRMERELAQGQKLEAVGRVAAGVAHEINTSVQFISDSVRFVRHALKDVPRALAAYRALAAGVLSGKDVSAAARNASDIDEAADVDYFLKNGPEALDRALEGITRVGSIVRSMTEFAHPDADVATDIDLNRAVNNTLNMARNEYKAVADLETRFGDIPRVRCHAGDINQVVLNLVLNAAHAVGDAVKGTSNRGRISVSTRLMGDYVEIAVADTGNGIPESVRPRIFEPFVTTKEVGRGTGQGLALSRSIVVEKLKGSLHFETETGRGTTFFIRLPASETQKQAAA